MCIYIYVYIIKHTHTYVFMYKCPQNFGSVGFILEGVKMVYFVVVFFLQSFLNIFEKHAKNIPPEGFPGSRNEYFKPRTYVSP